MARDRTCKSDIDDMQDRAAPRSMLLPSSSVAMCSIKSIACPSLSALPFRMPSTRGSQVIAPRSSGFRLRPCLVCPKCRSLLDQGSGNATPCQVSCNEVVGGKGFAWSWQPLFRKGLLWAARAHNRCSCFRCGVVSGAYFGSACAGQACATKPRLLHRGRVARFRCWQSGPSLRIAGVEGNCASGLNGSGIAALPIAFCVCGALAQLPWPMRAGFGV